MTPQTRSERPLVSAPAAESPIDVRRRAERRAEALRTYGRAVAAVRALFRHRGAFGAELCGNLAAAAGELADAALREDGPLLALAVRSTPGEYVYGHSVNLAVYALTVTAGLAWDRAKLRILGIAALVHDIGMKPWLARVERPRRLTPREARDVSLHATETARLVRDLCVAGGAAWEGVGALVRLSGRENGLRAVGGTGPLSAGEARRGAALLRLCDAFEAICHPRAWRPALSARDAIAALARAPEARADRRAAEEFLRRMTPYPPGTWVRLSDGELAVVVGVHPRAVLSPLVRVFDGSPAAGPAGLLDLRAAPHPFILAPVSPENPDAADRRLRAYLAAGRWWLG